MKSPYKEPIVFFDGDCALCHGFVRFSLKRSRNVLFSPLESELAKSTLPNKASLPDSIIVYKDGNIHTRFEALYAILENSQGLYRLLKVTKLLPSFFRDKIYDFIAKNRKRVQKGTTCPVPPRKDRARFIFR